MSGGIPFARDATTKRLTATAFDRRHTAHDLIYRLGRDLNFHTGLESSASRASRNQYIASGAADIDSADLEDAIPLIQRKGFGTTADSKIIAFCNPDEAEQIMAFRAGEPSRSGGPDAKYDFIPANDAPAFLSPAGELIGEQLPGSYVGVKVEGSYGPKFGRPERLRAARLRASGRNLRTHAPRNVCAFRQHPNPAYQNLPAMPGSRLNYPLVESFTARECGTGVRYRGGAVAIQVTTNPTYAPPVYRGVGGHTMARNNRRSTGQPSRAPARTDGFGTASDIVMALGSADIKAQTLAETPSEFAAPGPNPFAVTTMAPPVDTPRVNMALGLGRRRPLI